MPASALSHTKLRLESSKLFPPTKECHAVDKAREHTVKLVTHILNKQAKGPAPALLRINLRESLHNFP